jgi:hypothetical protein
MSMLTLDVTSLMWTCERNLQK